MLPALVLEDEGIKGEVTFPSCTSQPGILVCLIYCRPELKAAHFTDSRRGRPKEGRQLAQGQTANEWQDQELD